MSTDYAMFIDNKWTTGESSAQFSAFSPATGECIGTLPNGSRADVQRALTAAQRGFDEWASRTAFERAALLERTAAIISERRDALAHMLTLEQGKPLHAEAYAEVDDVIGYFRMAAADAVRIAGELLPSVDRRKRVLIQRVPRGVVGVITPWNWPYEMPAELIAPALGAGNTVVWVPAPSTSICAVLLAECLAEAGFPAGVFNLVTGQGAVVGDEVAANPITSVVAFIGSTQTGLTVAARAAGKELLLEMGGNGPLVILDDADLDAAVSATLTSCLLCAGQSCSAGELVMVQQSVMPNFQDRLLRALTERVRLGDPFAETTTLGPLNNEGVAAKMDRHIADALTHGAQVAYGGKRAANYPTRLYYEPTLLTDVKPMMLVAREESFGPIIPLWAIADESEALTWANQSEHGLLAAVFTQDMERGLRFAERIRAGWVNINESTNWWEIHLPFGGRAGSRSGVGRVGGRAIYERLTEPKTIVLNFP